MKSLKIIALLLFAGWCGPLWGLHIEVPGIKGRTSLAIITDSVTRARCAPAIAAYRHALEAEGLATFLIWDQWDSPHYIREILKELHRTSNLEGVVLVGEVPIVMVTRAQHLCSAFKMDERRFPLREVSVPTDRFYDDFDLEFLPTDSLKKVDGLMHFMQLSPDSPQYIRCDIYSGRIKAQKMLGDPCAQISAFLEKAAREHRATRPLSTLVSYTGGGSYSNSLVAWASESGILAEQFGDRFNGCNSAKFLRYSMDNFPKEMVVKELRRDDLSLMVLRGHGLPHRLYLSGDYPTGKLEEHVEVMREYMRSRVDPDAKDPFEHVRTMAAELKVDSTWYAGALDRKVRAADSLGDMRRGIVLEEIPQIVPRARMVIFDACCNGDFREGDFMAGMFTMVPGGRTVVGLGNSVNVSRDKSAFDLMGLLGLGMRAGQWMQHANILESHIIGDPTFRFAALEGAAAPDFAATEDAYWLERLGDPNPDVRNLALIRLDGNGYAGILDSLAAAVDSPDAVVRHNALIMLEARDAPCFRDALRAGVRDPFEFIRRISVNRMGRCGDEQFIPCLIDAYIDDYNSAGMIFDLMQSLRCFDKEKVRAAIEKRFAGAGYYNAAKQKAELLAVVDRDDAGKALKAMQDRKLSPGNRIFHIHHLRNMPYNQLVPDLLRIMEDRTDDPAVRVALAESLGWFTTSLHKPQIVASMKKLLADQATPREMHRELTRSVNKLKNREEITP